MLDREAQSRGGRTAIARGGRHEVAARARAAQAQHLIDEARRRLGPGASQSQVLVLANAIARARRIEAGIRGVINRQRTQPLTHPIVESVPERKELSCGGSLSSQTMEVTGSASTSSSTR